MDQNVIRPEQTSQSNKSKPVLRRLGELLVQRRKWILALFLLSFVITGIVGSGTIDALVLSRYEVPDSESVRVNQILEEQFQTGSPNVILLVTAKKGSVDDPQITNAGIKVMNQIAKEPNVLDTSSYWTRDRTPTLRSQDGKQALILVRFQGGPTEVRTQLNELSPRYTHENEWISVKVGGGEEVFRQAATQAREDFIAAELTVIPVVFVLLVMVYRRILPAFLTLMLGVLTVLGTLAILRGVTFFTEVSTFASNLTLVMGLALGIDYSLFMIQRFKEELRRGSSAYQAVPRTVETAGRTVIFSGVTVAISLSALLLFPFPFLQSFAYVGLAVVLTGIYGAVVILPAILALVGDRVEKWKWARTSSTVTQRKGFWHRTAFQVMKRPILFGSVVLILLLILSAPNLGLRFGLPDDRVLPESVTSRQVQDEIRQGFVAEETDALIVLTQNITDVQAKQSQIIMYAQKLSLVDGVTQVDSVFGTFVDGKQQSLPRQDSERFLNQSSMYLSVVPSIEKLETDAYGLVQEIRSLEAPFAVQVGGYPADLADFRDALIDRIAWVGLFVFVVTYLILFLMTGSLLIPLKATILNVLSLATMFGVLVWIFQEGHFSSLLGFTATGTFEPSIPILMFCIAYGLSMDYEVFIMSRIKEEYDRTGDLVQSVAYGIERSAPLVTAAAMILAVTFLTYATSGIVFLKMLGIGMTVAVLIDATLIRAILMPALMKLAGKANWWAPPFLKRIYKRWGFREAHE